MITKYLWIFNPNSFHRCAWKNKKLGCISKYSVIYFCYAVSAILFFSFMFIYSVQFRVHTGKARQGRTCICVKKKANTVRLSTKQSSSLAGEESAEVRVFVVVMKLVVEEDEKHFTEHLHHRNTDGFTSSRWNSTPSSCKIGPQKKITKFLT